MSETARGRSLEAGVGMSIASILVLLSGVLGSLALVFFLIGLTRTRRVSASGLKTGAYASKVARLLAIRRIEWRCATYLLCLALFLFTLFIAGSGPLFTELSGNLAGGVLLIAFTVGLVLAVVLIVRHRAVARAVRDLESKVRD